MPVVPLSGRDRWYIQLGRLPDWDVGGCVYGEVDGGGWTGDSERSDRQRSQLVSWGHILRHVPSQNHLTIQGGTGSSQRQIIVLAIKLDRTRPVSLRTHTASTGPLTIVTDGSAITGPGILYKFRECISFIGL
jgi:hypothetical protein